jgi:GH35 family endo-1,4-beta-xylanase
VSEKLLLSSDAESETYRKIFLQNFNTAVIENGMNWEEWEHNPKAQLSAVEWLLDNNILVRGHCLLWGSRRRMPKRISKLWDEPEKVRSSILDHVREEMSAFKGKLIEWDVLNEPFTENEVQQLLGEAFYVDLFRAARAADPDIKLDINDFSILESGGHDRGHQDFYEHIIQLLVDAHAPLGGIGMQSHFNNNLTGIPKVLKILDRFARFGLPIQATEFDVNVWDEKLQADYTRDFMTALFSHPGVSGIIIWGF